MPRRFGRATRCPLCGRRPRRRTPAVQFCDYCDSAWRQTPGGPSALRPSDRARWAIAAASGSRPGDPPRPLSGVALGILACPSDLDEALFLCRGLASRFDEALILLDSDAAPDIAVPARTRLLTRRLAGHFGRQRTALQRLSKSPWVLQLDTDETLDPDTIARLPGVVRAASRDGISALGLPRRNHVDGRLSDHYPDPQYRLCRRTVVYEGQVHERPRLLSSARQSRLALGLHIDHALTADRVRARTTRYDAMSAGATDTARPADERALLRPFKP